MLPVGALKLTRIKKKSCGKAVKDKAAEASENGYKKSRIEKGTGKTRREHDKERTGA